MKDSLFLLVLEPPNEIKEEQEMLSFLRFPSPSKLFVISLSLITLYVYESISFFWSEYKLFKILNIVNIIIYVLYLELVHFW